MGRPGVISIALLYGRRRPVAECVSCNRIRPLPCRGLCAACRDRHSDDGTLGDYGYVKGDRVEEYRILRLKGLNITEAGRRSGVSRRTAGRYEAGLIAAGMAPWREKAAARSERRAA
jgi:hypothetical protein